MNSALTYLFTTIGVLVAAYFAYRIFSKGTSKTRRRYTRIRQPVRWKGIPKPTKPARPKVELITHQLKNVESKPQTAGKLRLVGIGNRPGVEVITTKESRGYCVIGGSEFTEEDERLGRIYTCPRCGRQYHTQCLAWAQEKYRRRKIQKNLNYCYCGRRLPKIPVKTR